jgi:hypothetical protein
MLAFTCFFLIATRAMIIIMTMSSRINGEYQTAGTRTPRTSTRWASMPTLTMADAPLIGSSSWLPLLVGCALAIGGGG